MINIIITLIISILAYSILETLDEFIIIEMNIWNLQTEIPH